MTLSQKNFDDLIIESDVFIPLEIDDKRITLTQWFSFSSQKTHQIFEHVAIVFPSLAELPSIPLIRLHSECLTGDVFQSLLCDCGKQLSEAIHWFSKEGGVLFYLKQEGRGIGLNNKLKAYSLQQKQNLDTIEANLALGHQADERDFLFVVDMLRCLNLSQVRLLSNNPKKAQALREGGIHVVQELTTEVFSNCYNFKYLKTKHQKFKHLLKLP
jgi:GTP cyclohydrolase II